MKWSRRRGEIRQPSLPKVFKSSTTKKEPGNARLFLSFLVGVAARLAGSEGVSSCSTAFANFVVGGLDDTDADETDEEEEDESDCLGIFPVGNFLNTASILPEEVEENKGANKGNEHEQRVHGLNALGFHFVPCLDVPNQTVDTNCNQRKDDHHWDASLLHNIFQLMIEDEVFVSKIFPSPN